MDVFLPTFERLSMATVDAHEKSLGAFRGLRPGVG